MKKKREENNEQRKGPKIDYKIRNVCKKKYTEDGEEKKEVCSELLGMYWF